LTRVIAPLAEYLNQGPRFRRIAPQSPPSRGDEPLSIAIVDLVPNLGDTVMIFPLLDALEREQPDAVVDVFGAGIGRVMGMHPFVHRYFGRETRPWRGEGALGRASHVVDMWRQWRRDWSELRYDVCFVPRGGVDPMMSAHLAWMLGGARRIGYARALEPERASFDTGEDALFTDLVRQRSGAHEVTRGAEVLALAGLLRHPVPLDAISPSLSAIAESDEGMVYLAAHPELSQPYAVIAPGASVLRRCWTEEGFATLIEEEILPRGWLPVFIGASSERELCERVAKQLSAPSLILVGTSFAQLTALCKAAQCFIGNDSGTGHVAGALGVPTLEVTAFAQTGDPFHHASPFRSHPCGPFVHVVQPKHQLAPCVDECVDEHRRHCITQVTVQQMQTALRDLLAKRDSAWRA
jgi:ADP-heptose:LPS heptosyltransferase